MIEFPKPEVEQFFQIYGIQGFAVSDDEKRLVFSSNLNGHYNLWAMDLPDLYPYPLTYINQSNSFIEFDKQGRFILAGFDQDGDENDHIYALKPEGGVPLPLLPGEREDKFFFSHLSEDGERLYYVTSQNNPNFLNSRMYNLRTKEDELLHEGEETMSMLEAVSPNEQKLIIQKRYANTYAIGYLKQGEEWIPLSADPTQVQHNFNYRFIDNDTVLFITDYGQDFPYVAMYDLASRTSKTLISIPGESVGEIIWHKESKTLYLWTSKGVEDAMYTYDWENGELTQIDMPSDMLVQASVTKAGHVYLLARGATSPLNIYRYDGSWTQLTNNRVTGLNEQDLIAPDVIKYSSFDGLQIEALLFKAKPEVANGYTIFWPHGGPQAIEGKFFRSMFQYMLANGYSIFAPNFRGSTGYGSSFTKLVEGDWGEGPRLDCVAGIEWLFEQGISDRDKLFVVGGSYGGYMTLLLAGRHPEYFRAAVDIFGVSNLFTFINSVPEHWKPIMERWLGDAEKDKERLIKDSPITYLKQMVNPMLVIQGANDPRVVKAESDQIVEALHQQGVEVEYLVLEDEGHGFSKRENEMRVYKTIFQFLERHRS